MAVRDTNRLWTYRFVMVRMSIWRIKDGVTPLAHATARRYAEISAMLRKADAEPH